jgi:hypothetical protein
MKRMFGKVPEPPPGRGVTEVAGVRPALGLPVEPAAVDPVGPQPVDVVVARRHGAGRDTGGDARGQPVEVAVGQLRIVVPERHEDVARVAGHDDVAHLRVVRQAVERQVALDEAAVPLRLEPRPDLGDLGVLPVEPGGDRRVPDW